MLKVAVAVLLFAYVATAVKLSPPFTDAELKDAFVYFQKTYNRVYQDADEFNVRFANFKNNMDVAQQLQKQNPRARFGVTKFSDYNEAELARLRMVNFNATEYKTKLSQVPVKSSFRKSSLHAPNPTTYDWGQAGVITSVYNQGQCGSCWAFSATETIESYYALAGGQLTSLAMEQIVDCDTGDDGCNGGFPANAYQYVESAGGIEPYSDYPYTAENGYSGECQFNSGDILVQVTNYQSLSGERGLYNQLSSAGPVSVCVDASSWPQYQGGVLTSCGNDVDHCVQATGYVGYGSGGAYWNVRNSWGTDWGEDGYIWVQIGQDLCSIGDYCTVVSTNSK